MPAPLIYGAARKPADRVGFSRNLTSASTTPRKYSLPLRGLLSRHDDSIAP